MFEFGGSALHRLPYLRNCRSKRISSYDRTGGNADGLQYDPIKPGERRVLADIEGAGCIRHIWVTIACSDRHFLRKLVLRMYWDGEENPSVETPIGDFFGMGHCITTNFVSLPITAAPRDGRGFNCYFPMPYAERALIEVENQCEVNVDAFYYYIDYEEYEKLPEDVGRFHAWWNRECPTKAMQTDKNITGDENYLILDAEGQGHYVGVIYNVHGLQPGWWGEGDDMIFIDGEKWPPSLHGTGTEDYFCGAWCFQEKYNSPYHGLIHIGHPDWTGKYTMYRFHIEDPVVFHKSIRVTIEHGHANDRSDDISSVAFWYQREPHKKFPPLPPVEARLPIENYRINPR